HRLDLVELTSHALFTACRLKLEFALQVEPELRRGVEIGPEPQSSVCGDALFLSDDALNPRPRHTNASCQAIGGQIEGLHELLAEHFARMQRGQLVHDCAPSQWESMIFTRSAPPAFQIKQIRPLRFTQIACCPARP